MCLSSLYLEYLSGSGESWENHAGALSAAPFSSLPTGPVYSPYHAPQHCEENRKSKTNLALNVTGRLLVVYSLVYSLLKQRSKQPKMVCWSDFSSFREVLSTFQLGDQLEPGKTSIPVHRQGDGLASPSPGKLFETIHMYITIQNVK